MDMHLLLVCDQQLSKIKGSNISEKIGYLCDENNAKGIFQSAINFIGGETYLFERRGFYSGPKTKQMIKNLVEINDIK